MLTPHLEKLILCGKATYNTLCVGGSEKTIFNVPQDRYIIITDITIHNGLDRPTIELTDNEMNTLFKSHSLTQLSIFSDRSYNHFVIRNEYNISQWGLNWHVTPKGHFHFDTFLVHNNDIAFSWVKSIDHRSGRANTPAESVGRPLPFDYGKDGQAVAGVVIENILSTATPWRINQGGSYTATDQTMSNELQYPVTPETTPIYLDYSFQFPIANIQYVEVFGNLDNISATL